MSKLSLQALTMKWKLSWKTLLTQTHVAMRCGNELGTGVCMPAQCDVSFEEWDVGMRALFFPVFVFAGTSRLMPTKWRSLSSLLWQSQMQSRGALRVSGIKKMKWVEIALGCSCTRGKHFVRKQAMALCLHSPVLCIAVPRVLMTSFWFKIAGVPRCCGIHKLAGQQQWLCCVHWGMLFCLK